MNNLVTNDNKTPLDYAKLLCDSMMNRYAACDLPPKGVFFYHQGVFLSGMQQTYKICKDKKYFQYIKDYIDSVIGPNGEMYGVDYEATDWRICDGWEEPLKLMALALLDSKQPVILLYDLLEETGDKKYEKAIKTVSDSMYYWPVNQLGGYWHMMDQHHQMWLDGLYMAGPLCVMYADKYGDERLRERAIKQIFIYDENLKDEKTGLLYHGFDPSKQAEWADPETGLSPNFWGRALGWYCVAILDMLDYIPEDHPKVEEIKKIEREILAALAKFQDPKSGMWFEVVDKIDRDDNWTESSCTCLFAYAYAKAMRKGVVGDEYAEVLERAYAGILDSTEYDENGNLILNKICCGTCIESGSYEHYINRTQIKNDLHGTGAFLLMCAEAERYRLWKESK